MAAIKMGQSDNVLQYINKNFITLQDEDKKRYMPHYQSVLQEIVTLMKQEDKLFEAIYQNLYWAGSYYDGLKVGKPEEYDVDVVMNLPIPYDTVQIVNKKVTPPFVKINMKEMDSLKQHPRWTEVYRHLDSWTDKDGFLLQSKFRTWMESAVNKALLKLPKSGTGHQMSIGNHKYLITLRKCGPAMTFNITIPGGIKLDVDFVPVFEFKKPLWPPNPIRKNPSSTKDVWFIVPKPNSKLPNEFQDTYWRLAFHDQEREMINGKEQLKPVLRLLKKFRDNHTILKCLCSYYLKTMFLWEVLEQKDSTFWKSGLTNQFMTMLKKLHDNIENRKYGIKYFWDERYDFLLSMSEAERQNIQTRLSKIIKDIEKTAPEDPTVLAKYLLTKEELATFTAAYSSPAPLSPSPPPTVAGNVKTPSPVKEVKTPPTPDNDSLLHTILVTLIEQKKLTQTLLNKVNILQASVDRLTDENSSLRDELKLVTQFSCGSLSDTIKATRLPAPFDQFDLLDSVSETDSCLPMCTNLQGSLLLSPSGATMSFVESVTPKDELNDLLLSF